MKEERVQLLFPTRDSFRAWLLENAETSGGVWLIFGKNRSVRTLKASEALEEALCFGWIDGQMESIDDTKYIKYFAKRRANSVWSVKNKNLIPMLREKGIMTELGEKAIAAAKANGRWDERTAEGERAMVEEFKQKLTAYPSAYEGFLKLPPSTQLAEARLYNYYKTEEKREQTFREIIGRLS